MAKKNAFKRNVKENLETKNWRRYNCAKIYNFYILNTGLRSEFRPCIYLFQLIVCCRKLMRFTNLVNMFHS